MDMDWQYQALGNCEEPGGQGLLRDLKEISSTHSSNSLPQMILFMVQKSGIRKPVEVGSWNPIIYRVLCTIPGGWPWDFWLPSTGKPLVLLFHPPPIPGAHVFWTSHISCSTLIPDPVLTGWEWLRFKSHGCCWTLCNWRVSSIYKTGCYTRFNPLPIGFLSPHRRVYSFLSGERFGAHDVKIQFSFDAHHEQDQQQSANNYCSNVHKIGILNDYRL